MKISVSIVVHNEARFLRTCLESVKWADEIIIVDTGSTDDSVKIAAEYTEKIFIVENDPNININKQKGIDKCSGDWILYLDPDEEISSALADEFKSAVNESAADAYLIPRKNIFFGKWLKWGGHYPDYQLRFFKKGRAHFPCEDIHERLAIDGIIGKMKTPLLHYTAISKEFYRDKLKIKAEFTGRKMYEKLGSKRFQPFVKYMILKPMAYFIIYFLFKGEFLNGTAGIWAFKFKVLNAAMNYQHYVKCIVENEDENNTSA